MTHDYAVLNSVMHLSDSSRSSLNQLFDETGGDASWKMQNFPLYAPRQAITKFMAREEMFRQVLAVQGSIVECGVFGGGGLMAWLQLSSILEPLNYQRRIIGFDSFAGFPQVAEHDRATGNPMAEAGQMALDSYSDIQRSAGWHAGNMILKWPDKLQLVRGDACQTIPQYVQDHPELVISLLYLDFDIYPPTRTALEALVPRMPKGAVIAFDELNDPAWPGETTAVMEMLGLNRLELKRFTYDTKVCYAVLE